MRRVVLRAVVALLVTLVAHVTLLSRVQPQGVRPDLLLLLAVVGGVAGGPERGAVLGFFAGLVADLFVQTPFGLTALAFSLVGFGVGSLQSMVLKVSWWMPVATALAASAAGVVLFAVLATVVGETRMMSPRLALVAAIVALLNAVLSLPMVRLVDWAFAEPGARR